MLAPLFAPIRTNYFPTKRFWDIVTGYFTNQFQGRRSKSFCLYGDHDKHVKTHASDDQDDLRCETLSEGALCKEGVWQVSLLSQVFVTIIINIIAIINSEPIL